MGETTRRRSYESGHHPTFLVVVDGTTECDRAVHFGARRAARVGGRLVMLAVVAPPDDFEWLGVSDALQEEAEAEAMGQLEVLAAKARAWAPVVPEILLRVGEPPLEIATVIREDEDIAFLVLAAAPGPDGPGPLVTGIAGRGAGSFPVPVVIVPGMLTDEEIVAIAG